MNELLDAVAAWYHAGSSPLPKKTGRKSPVMPGWQEYAHKRPSPQDLADWDFSAGICLPMGGNTGLEGFEFDCDEARDGKGDARKLPGTAQSSAVAFGDAMRSAGLSGLWDRVLGGYCEQSPSGGLHVFVRYESFDVPGNEKWARYASGKTKIETRGTGGQYVIAPSPGYVVLTGSPSSVAVITPAERDSIRVVAGSLDDKPAPVAQPQQRSSASTGNAYVSLRGWNDILEPAGWTEVPPSGANASAGFTQAWARPDHVAGGESGEYSAVSSEAVLMIFSSTAQGDFEDAGFPGTVNSNGSRTYTMSQAYATYNGGASLYNDDDEEGYLSDKAYAWLDEAFPGRGEELIADFPRLQAIAQEKDRFTALRKEDPAAAGHELVLWAVREGMDARNIPVAARINPAREWWEPKSSSDTDLAYEILEFCVFTFKLDEDSGAWYQNAGTCWVPFGTKSEVNQRTRTMVAAAAKYLKPVWVLDEELARQGTAASGDEITEDDKRRERLVKLWAKLGSTAGHSSVGTAIVTIAYGDRRYSFTSGHADAEPDALWAGAYAWSLVSPELRDITPQVNPVHLKTAVTAPYPGPTPAWDNLLRSIWPDTEVRAWALREVAAAALWGATSKAHPVLDGQPQGGKSTFAEIIHDVLDTYAVKADPEKILGGRMDSAAEEEVSRMIGARLVWLDEPPPGDKQSVSRFNDLASGAGDLTASRKYHNSVSAPKRFNFLICQNPRNALRMDAQGVGERMTYIPCDGTPETTRDARSYWLKEGKSEYPAILAQLIRECALYHTEGPLPVPYAAQIGRARAQERSDEVASWVLDVFTVEPGMPNSERQYTANTVWKMYQVHTREAKLPGVSRAEFKDRLLKLGADISDTGYAGKYSLASLRPKAVAFTGYPS